MKTKGFLKAVILIAGPQKGTRFRPLSLDVPKPLFPLAGLCMIEHQIEACTHLENIKEILIIGFYPPGDLAQFIQEMTKKYEVELRHLQEFAPLGTAGGIYHFRDQIRSGSPAGFFVFNGDVCADFPLRDLTEFHDEASLISLTGTEATKQQSLNFGCMVEDKETHSLLHYVEKPGTYVSTLINCGIYLFSTRIFDTLQKVFQENQAKYYARTDSQVENREAIWLEKDILTPLAGTSLARVHQITKWWSQMKTAGSAIYANRGYLKLYSELHPSRLSVQTQDGPCIRGNVFVHSTAKVHPSAVVGPNVSIGKNVTISAGARVKESIILDDSIVGEHSLVMYSVVGYSSRIGNWCRVEGTPSDPNPNKPFAKMENETLFNVDGKLNPSITILGCNVNMSSEMVLLNTIVLPHKVLNRSFKNEIIL
uniref:Mannose-1-phosphate guanyltransferase alpha-A n=1 Tax=Caligus clemensi TaxID=344056 RepID=C1C1B3_CALCM|nr:Mannose-1-phosphate guanyltransferase alpha-A [Caligus clemensi]